VCSCTVWASRCIQVAFKHAQPYRIPACCDLRQQQTKNIVLTTGLGFPCCRPNIQTARQRQAAAGARHTDPGSHTAGTLPTCNGPQRSMSVRDSQALGPWHLFVQPLRCRKALPTAYLAVRWHLTVAHRVQAANGCVSCVVYSCRKRQLLVLMRAARQ
jgi:hypothetical protein